MTNTIRTMLTQFQWVLVLVTTSIEAADPFSFVDVTRKVGLHKPLQGINGHGAGWGDLDQDGFPELYVGTFDKTGNHPGTLFWYRNGQFVPDETPLTHTTGRANSVLFVDFDNDGDLDIYQSNLSGGKQGYASADSRLLRNDGDSHFTDVSKESGACPAGFRGRSATVLDFDGDADLDLLIGAALHYGSDQQCRLLRNDGGLKFSDATRQAGIPSQMAALGVAAGDANRDGWPDVFFAARGANRLFMNNQKGGFVEHAQSPKLFQFEYIKGDDTSAGVCFGDVNNDGWQDIVVGQHFDRPWQSPTAIRLYLNTGAHKKSNRESVSIDENASFPSVRFEDVTAGVGLVPLQMKAPHVEMQDFDNDGTLDIQTSIVKYADGGVHPIIFRGVPQAQSKRPTFKLCGWNVNDFPTNQDKAIRRTGDFYKKLLTDKKVMYTAPAPSCDYNRDGQLDIFYANWFAEQPSLLLQNRSSNNRWLRVQLNCLKGINRMGIGCVVSVYDSGHAGDSAHLVGSREIAVGYGYASGQEAIAHFGMGSRHSCDLEIRFPHGLGFVRHKNVETNTLFKTNLAAQRLRLRASTMPSLRFGR